MNSIQYWHMQWDQDCRIQGENRVVDLSLDLPYPILFRLLVTPSAGLQIQNAAASFFRIEVQRAPKEVIDYLSGFFKRIDSDCEPGAMDMRVMSARKFTDLDFPRPSPSWMMIREFCKLLKAEPVIFALLSAEASQFLR